jgi:hypothetical protein
LEDCIFVANQEQAFEAGFSNGKIMDEAKWNSKWIG